MIMVAHEASSGALMAKPIVIMDMPSVCKYAKNNIYSSSSWLKCFLSSIGFYALYFECHHAFLFSLFNISSISATACVIV